MFKSFQNRAGWERGPLLLCLPHISLLITISLWSCPLSVWFWWGCQPQEPPGPLTWLVVVSFIPGHGHFPRIKHMTQAEPIRVVLWDFIYGHTLSPWMLLTWSCYILFLLLIALYMEDHLVNERMRWTHREERREMERVPPILFQSLESLNFSDTWTNKSDCPHL